MNRAGVPARSACSETGCRNLTVGNRMKHKFTFSRPNNFLHISASEFSDFPGD